MHAPLTQPESPQARPQEPQWLGSLFRSTHLFAQLTVPAGHIATVPPEAITPPLAITPPVAGPTLPPLPRPPVPVGGRPPVPPVFGGMILPPVAGVPPCALPPDSPLSHSVSVLPPQRASESTHRQPIAPFPNPNRFTVRRIAWA